ncbi:hypothetical protein ACFU8W_49360 [Streptomyces sp. NPDC057565]|uniref:hypothetical protein n=1 Tax=Streptomyces sp. NPDC057565 TaxID=3346169 RepID=UPI0036C18E78
MKQTIPGFHNDLPKYGTPEAAPNGWDYSYCPDECHAECRIKCEGTSNRAQCMSMCEKACTKE